MYLLLAWGRAFKSLTVQVYSIQFLKQELPVVILMVGGPPLQRNCLPPQYAQSEKVGLIQLHPLKTMQFTVWFSLNKISLFIYKSLT